MLFDQGCVVLATSRFKLVEVDVQCDLAVKLKRSQANAGRGCGASVVKHLQPTLATVRILKQQLLRRKEMLEG